MDARIPLRLAAMAALALGATPLVAAAGASPSTATRSVLQPETLARAAEIRASVNARFRLVPGRRLSVTEASSTGVVDSLTLLPEFRVIPTDNGVYYAICSVRATCPYPVRSASWPAGAFLPRRIALELALRTFVETPATLVVVALPTVRPTWLVFERDDVAGELDAGAALNHLAIDPPADARLQQTVDRLTIPRLFVPLAIVPESSTTETILAVPLSVALGRS